MSAPEAERCSVQLKGCLHLWVESAWVDCSDWGLSLEQGGRAKWEEKADQSTGLQVKTQVSILLWICIYSKSGFDMNWSTTHWVWLNWGRRGDWFLRWQGSHQSVGWSGDALVSTHVLVQGTAEQLETIRALTSPLMDLYWHGAALVSGKPKGTCH